VTGPFLTDAQVRAIGRQEGATDDDLAEALRRLRLSPRFLAGEVQSPGAFFRGIVRGVLADRAPPPSAATYRPPPPAQSPTPPQPPGDRTFGHICLRAMHLFRSGATDADVIATLVVEFQAAPIIYITQAMDQGRDLYRALSR
jgi:hypothetical protein